MTIAEVCQVILGLGSLAVAYAAYSLAKRVDAISEAERRRFELALQRYRRELIYQSRMTTLAILVQNKAPGILQSEYDVFQKLADKIVPPLTE